MMTSALPMESNPEIMNKYLQKLGVSDKWQIVDVIGLEGEALTWVPKPVLALILLFPMSDAYEQHRISEEQEVLSKTVDAQKNIFHLRQVQSNICGTIALVHSVANNTHNIELNEGLLKNYIREAKDLDAAAKGALLESSTAILNAYKEIVQAGDAIVDESEVVNNHFVTFIHKNGTLYELDGRKTGPVNHGETTSDTLLEDAAKVCQEFIEREPDNIGFTVVALVPSPQ